jgi:probable DNA repair protein
LHEVFEPDYFSPTTNRNNLPFNFSAGYPLADAPIISAALDGLELCFSTVPAEAIVRVCQSPFYCLDESDTELSCKLVNLVLEERNTTLSAGRFRQLAEKVSASHQLLKESGWQFSVALQNQANIAREEKLSQSRPPSQWLTVFNRLLTAIAWPGKRSLDSEEYQQHSQWQGALQIYGQMNPLVPRHNYRQAVNCLKAIVGRQTFQAETPDSSLQVLGTLEAAGLQFSHLWLMSMSETQWPPVPSPHPLLPFSLQQEQSMPHANAERELDFATKISQRFMQDSKQFVVSFPAVVDDCDVGVSPLFKDFPQVSIEQLLGKELKTQLPLYEIRRRHIESSQLENYQSGSAPIVSSKESVKGGASLFASQAACPFRAFVKHRLKVTALPEPQQGLSAAERGTILHRALELVWGRLKSQEGLLSQSSEQLEQLCIEAASYAITQFMRERRDAIGKRFSELEQGRLKQLLLGWLLIERGRANFTVEFLEHPQVFRFASLELTTKVDRIDRLDDGSRIVIDYKTGKPNIKQWWGDRPDDPQLPLYSMLYDQNSSVSAIAFVQIHADGSHMKGVGSDEIPEKSLQWNDKVKSAAGAIDWPQLKKQWVNTLTQLAEDFIAGRAEVDPKKPVQTCQYCDYQSVCRVDYKNSVTQLSGKADSQQKGSL